MNDTVAVVAKSSAPMEVPSGLVPNLSLRAASSPRNIRSGCLGPAGARPRGPVELRRAAE